MEEIKENKIDNGSEKRSEGGQPGNKNAQKWTEEMALELGNALIEWIKPKYMPDPNYKPEKGGKPKTVDVHTLNVFFEKFLIIQRDLYPDVIRYLSETYESFSDLIEKAKKIQELKLKEYAVHKKIDTTMSIFLLKTNHGHTEKSQIETIDKTPLHQKLAKVLLEGGKPHIKEILSERKSQDKKRQT